MTVAQVSLTPVIQSWFYYAEGYEPLPLGAQDGPYYSYKKDFYYGPGATADFPLLKHITLQTGFAFDPDITFSLYGDDISFHEELNFGIRVFPTSFYKGSYFGPRAMYIFSGLRYGGKALGFQYGFISSPKKNLPPWTFGIDLERYYPPDWDVEFALSGGLNVGITIFKDKTTSRKTQ